MRSNAEAKYSRPIKYIIVQGRLLTLADLPAQRTRWVIRRKAEVVAAVNGGLLTIEDACERYNLMVEEFLHWERALERNGIKSLRATRRLPKRDNQINAEVCEGMIRKQFRPPVSPATVK